MKNGLEFSAPVEKDPEQFQAFKEKWHELAENSVFPLEHAVNSLGHSYSYLKQSPKQEIEFLDGISKDIEKIDPETLLGVIKNTEESDFYELTGRAVDSLGHLFNRDNYRQFTNENPELRERIMIFVNEAREKIVPVLQSVVDNGSFLAQLKKDTEAKKFAYHDIEFVSHISSFLNEDGQKCIYTFFQEIGCYSDLVKILQCDRNMIDLVGKYGSEAEQKMIEDIFFDAYLAKTPRPPNGFNGNALKYEWFQKITGIKGQGSFGRGIFKTAEKAFNRVKLWFKDEYGMDLRDIAKKQIIKIAQWPDELRTICEIENQRAGGAKILSDKYGIRCFYRYPSDMLIKQIDDEKEQLPYGVILYAYDDHNDAFANDNIKISSLSDRLTTGNTTLKIVEAGSGIEFMKRLIQLNNQFGQENKVSFLIVNAHGQEDNFLLSNQSLAESTVVQKEMLGGKGVQRMRDFFVSHPEIVLLSCSTGAKGGIGEKISETFGAHVVAPSQPTGVRNVSVKFDESNNPHFNVTFSKEDTLKEYGVSK